MSHASALLLLLLPFVPSQIVDDADGDGVPDELDVCALGDDNVDVDGDGTPDACDCAPDDADRGALVPDVCDNVDNDCNGSVDRHSVLDVRGAELKGRIGRGLAENPSTRQLDVTGTSLSVGVGQSSDIYYREPLDLLTANGVREATVRVKRVPTPGDNDFQVAISDGTRVISMGIFNDDSSVQYLTQVHVGVTNGSQFDAQYVRHVPSSSPYKLFHDGGQTYLMTFRATAAGTSVRLLGDRYVRQWPVELPPQDSLDPNVPWTLLLIGNSPAETYTIESLAVDQPLPAPGGVDADGDGYPTSCDCRDDDPLVNSGALEECDGLDRDCRPQTHLEEHGVVFGGLGSQLVNEIDIAEARKHAARSVTAEGTSLVVGPAASGSNHVFFRRELPLTVPTTNGSELEVFVEVDRVPVAGDQDFEVGIAFEAQLAEPAVFTIGLHDAEGSTGARYEVRGQYGQLYPDHHVFQPTQVSSGVVLDEHGPWLFTFRVTRNAGVTAEVRSAGGQTATLTFPPPASPGTGPLELALIAGSAATSLTVRSVDVALTPQDTDGDGICDYRDWCAGFDGVLDRDGDGVRENCDCNDLRADVGPHLAEVCDGRDVDCDGQVDLARLAGGAGLELAAEVARGHASGPVDSWRYTGSALRTTDVFDYQRGYAKSLGDIRRADGTAMLRLRVNLTSEKYLALSDGDNAIALHVMGAVWVATLFEEELEISDCTGPTGTKKPGCAYGVIASYPNQTIDDVVDMWFIADGSGQRVVNDRPWQSFSSTPGWSAVAQGNVAVIPPNAQLDLSRPIKAWIFGRQILEATVSAALDDDDGDLVCDARDLCAGQDDRLDADLDGVPDGCDMCLGPDGAFDADGDGFPSGCDCDVGDATRYPGQEEVCDGIDNDCDLLPDVSTLLSARGAELSSQLLRGEATGVSTRAVTPVLDGRAVSVEASTGAAAGEVYYRKRLGAVRVDEGETRVLVRVDRAPAAGDHDFRIALSDGQTAFGLALQDAGSSVGLGYQALAFVTPDAGATALPLAGSFGAGRVIEDASPYEVEVVFGADPRLEVLTARNERFTLRPPSAAAVAGMNLDRLDLLLIADQAAERYTVRSLAVRQRLPDADGDGVCDAIDRCAGGDDTGLDSDGDGIVDACDVCPFGPDDDDEDGDGVPDACDLCPGGDDALDADADGVPDACDECPDDYANDADGDGVCDPSDLCFGFDDHQDFDGDGVPDGCDRCPLDADNDSDEDGSCDAADVCRGNDRSGDKDGDGWCADLDCDDTRAHIHPGAPEVCDGYDSDCDGKIELTEMDLDHDGVIDCIAALAAPDAGPDAGHVAPPDEGCTCSQGSSSPAPWGLALLGLFALPWRRRSA